MLRPFFWTGPDLKASGDKVKWQDVCDPKAVGGLGFRAPKDWNRATMSRYLWAWSKKAEPHR